MDLKSGALFWPAVTLPVHRYQRLEQDLCCDIAVIGGGVTGALAAHHLARAGASVVVLDRRDIACGSTAASTGLLQYEIDTPLFRLMELIGADRARRAYRLCVKCLSDFRSLVGTLDDDCGLVSRPSLYLACEPDDIAELRREHDARQEIGIDVELRNGRELRDRFGIDRPAALWSRQAMEIDPYRLTHALMRSAVAAGAAIHAATQVEHYEASEQGVTITTDAGYTVRALNVIFATGYESPAFLDQDICRLRSTYALASRPLGNLEATWPSRCLIWESGDPYFYARTTTDGGVMIGGEDIDSSDPAERDRQIEAKARALCNKFHNLMPALRIEPEYRWAGTFAQTKDGLPYIGRSPQFPRGYFALGYGGNGITFGLIAAQIIRDLFTGRRSEDAELFSFDR